MNKGSHKGTCPGAEGRAKGLHSCSAFHSRLCKATPTAPDEAALATAFQVLPEIQGGQNSCWGRDQEVEAEFGFKRRTGRGNLHGKCSSGCLENHSDLFLPVSTELRRRQLWPAEVRREAPILTILQVAIFGLKELACCF